jgi:CTP:molybdopterin cytidylyltransferase MocA
MKNDFDDTVVIILAGGKSSRAETIKGLRKYKNNYWIDHQIDFFINLGIKQIFIGLAYHSEKYSEESYYLKSKSPYITKIINQNPENGPFSTLKAVITEALNSNWQKSIIIHIDHVTPLESTIKSLLNLKEFDVVKPQFLDKSGHPIVLMRSFCQALLAKSDLSTLAKEIRNLPLNKIKWVDVNDDNIHFNLNDKNSWEEYLRLTE